MYVRFVILKVRHASHIKKKQQAKVSFEAHKISVRTQHPILSLHPTLITKMCFKQIMSLLKTLTVGGRITFSLLYFSLKVFCENFVEILEYFLQPVLVMNVAGVQVPLPGIANVLL